MKGFGTEFKSNIERWDIRFTGQGRAGGQAGLLAAPPGYCSVSFKGNLPTPLWGSWFDLSAATAKGTEDFYQRPQQPMHRQWVFFPESPPLSLAQ